MPRFVTCGPNEAIIVSGCCHSNPTIRAGGRVFVWPIFHKIQRISLNTMTLNVESQKVYSDSGVPVTVKGVAQVKIQGKDLASLRAASEMFLDKTEEEIMDIAKATLDGHQRSMIASTTIDNIYKNRHEFSKNVQQSAQTDLIDMGLTLVSYTVQDISDEHGHLDALGQSRTIAVRAEARKEIAEAKSCSEKKNLEMEYTKKVKDLEREQSAALMKLDFEESEARRNKAIFENKAKSEKAGDLKRAEMEKLIAEQQFEVALLEKERETELITKRKIIKEIELRDKIERKADFEYQRQIDLAKAYAEKEKTEAKANAEKTKRLAEAQANIIRIQKEAEAQVLMKRAEAFAQFGNAAKLEMVLAMLPRLTAEIAGPITDCKKITSVSQDGSIGFSRITSEVFEVIGQVCDSVSLVTGQSLGNNNDDSGSGNSSSGPSNRKLSTESVSRTGSTLADRTLMSSSASRFGFSSRQ